MVPPSVQTARVTELVKWPINHPAPCTTRKPLHPHPSIHIPQVKSSSVFSIHVIYFMLCYSVYIVYYYVVDKWNRHRNRNTIQLIPQSSSSLHSSGAVYGLQFGWFGLLLPSPPSLFSPVRLSVSSRRISTHPSPATQRLIQFNSSILVFYFWGSIIFTWHLFIVCYAMWLLCLYF